MRLPLLLLITFNPLVAQQRDGPVVFWDVSVIDATSPTARQHLAVIVDQGRINWIGPLADARPPAIAARVDGRGKYLIPGLWDLHVHLTKVGAGSLPLFIANGVTSVRDVGSDFREVDGWRREIETGKRPGPRIKTSGPILESASNVQRMLNEQTVEPVARIRAPIRDSAHAHQVIDSMAKLDVDFLKIRTVASRSALIGIINAARQHGLMLVGHPPGILADDTLRRAWRSYEHAFTPLLDDWTPERRMSLWRELAARGTATVPTLVTARESLLAPLPRASAIVEDSTGQIDPRRRYISPYLVSDWREQVAERKGMDVQPIQRLLASALRNLKEMHAAGVRIMPGTDAAVVLIYPGFTLHDELRWLVEEGIFTPWEALVAATREPAAFFGIDRELGTIEPGKLADLVLLDANPLENIRNTTKISGVMTRGAWWDRARLDQMLHAARR